MATIAPIHPGEVLLEDFLTPLEVTQHRLAISIGVPPRRINEIVHGKRRITADTALRLARYFGTTDRFWLNLQTRYDLETEKDHLGTALDRITPCRAPDQPSVTRRSDAGVRNPRPRLQAQAPHRNVAALSESGNEPRPWRPGRERPRRRRCRMPPRGRFRPEVDSNRAVTHDAVARARSGPTAAERR